MRKLPKPCDADGKELVPAEVFDICTSSVDDPGLKKRLQGVRAMIASAAKDYDGAASAAVLHTLPRQSSIGGVTKSELNDVYTERMANRNGPGRPIYARILGVPSHGLCPLCGVGTVNTLDHHLPKAKYPQFSVTPDNLVPACKWCQGEKRASFPKAAGEQTIHPYFDDFSSAVWLHAEVVQGVPASFRFFVRKPVSWPSLVGERLNSHFGAFNLHGLFAANAGNELAGIRLCLGRLLGSGGRDAVRDHLQEQADSRGDESLNSWQAAMYRAAAASDWFCDGGFAPK